MAGPSTARGGAAAIEVAALVLVIALAITASLVALAGAASVG